MVIAIASGKGGTGKTTVAVNLALSVGNVQLLDCDVEEPNAHIFLKPEILKEEIACTPLPQIDDSKCDRCGKCAEICAYNAIAVFRGSGANPSGGVLVFPHLCHSCGACTALCPKGAISEIDRPIGIIQTGKAGEIEFVRGRLDIGEAMSPPLINLVKKRINPKKTVIIDAPPGTSCPMVTSIKGSDFCILVTEPTPFGLNDLILAIDVVGKLGIPFGVVINRYDLGTDCVEEYCRTQQAPVLMRIPFSEEIARLYSKGEPIVRNSKEYKSRFLDLYKSILGRVE